MSAKLADLRLISTENLEQNLFYAYKRLRVPISEMR